MARTPTNPIDPATGRRKRGRPPIAKPIDSMQGSPPVEMAVGERPPAEVQSVDVSEDIKRSVETGRVWYERMAGVNLLEPPTEVQRKYPDHQFAWARNSKEGVSEYRSRFGYEVAEADAPLRGQVDTSIVHGDLVLMVRPMELKKVHDQVRRDRLQRASGVDMTGRASLAEAAALNESARESGRTSDVKFFEDDRTVTPAMQQGMSDREVEDRLDSDRQRESTRGAAGRGSRYVSGGIPS